ncbi:hypothetical protein J5N97_023497 [Dioscorea zingiberensis]|uniref:RING-type domain-containing protein n=1 Tax=Dioscorea zingiberensis TaxID=325984 RepID=A0A9D5C5C7_9LILI|nr:hypothetical protein J5N97_023497 [Dioscorea zingiberensis]
MRRESQSKNRHYYEEQMSSREEREGRERGGGSDRGRRWMGSPSPPDLDSTSELLGGLNLIEKNAPDKRYMQDMDEIDLITVVPDSPDRLTMKSQSGFSAVNIDTDGRFSLSPSNQRKCHTAKVQSCQSRGSRSHDLLRNGNLQDEGEHLSRHASLAQLLAEDLEGKISSLTGGTSIKHEQDRIFNEHGMSFSPSACFHSSAPRDSRKDIDKGLYLLENEGSQKGESCGLFNLGTAHSKLPESICEEKRVDMLTRGNIQSKFADKGKGIDLNAYSKGRSVQSVSRALVDEGQRSLVHDCCISPCSIIKTSNSSILNGHNTIDSSVDGETLFSLSRSKNVNFREDLVMDGELRNGQICQRQFELDVFPQRNRQKRLVHNNFIPPCNVGGDDTITSTEDDQAGRNIYDIGSDGSSSRKVNIVSPDSEERFAGKKKGKSMIHDNVASRFQHTKDKARSNRPCSVANKEVFVGTNSGGDSLRSSAGKGWRKSLNCNPEDAIDVPKREDIIHITDSPVVTASHERDKPSSAQATSNVVSGGRSHRRQKMMKGKRKNNSFRAQDGECSSSAFEDSEVLFVESPVQPSKWRSTRSRNSQRHGETAPRPVIEINELDFSEVGCSNSEEQSSRVSDDSSATARQVESDEILARQLQEQLFNESPDFDISEQMDENMAMSLQQEENLHLFGRRGQAHHSRDSSMAHLYAQYPQMTSRRTFHDRSQSSRMPQPRRHSRRSWADSERRNFLDALEAEFNNRSRWSASNSVSPLHAFNGNEYETLLALDNHNQHVGASQSQIDNLPESIVQSGNIEEACVICLETPTTGDTIRHLPCLHKFHKHCIDKWLKRKKSCPVCKSGIT